MASRSCAHTVEAYYHIPQSCRDMMRCLNEHRPESLEHNPPFVFCTSCAGNEMCAVCLHFQCRRCVQPREASQPSNRGGFPPRRSLERPRPCTPPQPPRFPLTWNETRPLSADQLAEKIQHHLGETSDVKIVLRHTIQVKGSQFLLDILRRAEIDPNYR